MLNVIVHLLFKRKPSILEKKLVTNQL